MTQPPDSPLVEQVATRIAALGDMPLPLEAQVELGEIYADVRDLEHRLAVLQPLLDERGWKPIESAPKDGTKILLFTDWAGDVHCPPFAEAQIGYWEDDVDAPLRKEASGWRKEFIGEPTHWMPLPEPPESKGDAP
jgi:hypothetical protein